MTGYIYKSKEEKKVEEKRGMHMKNKKERKEKKEKNERI